MAEHFRLSEASWQVCQRMQRMLRISDRPALLRLAFAKALVSGVRPDFDTDNKGPEIPLSVVTRHQDMMYDALIAQVLGGPLDTTERRRTYKGFVDQGLGIIGKEFQQVGENTDYLLNLARQVVGQ